MPGPDDLDELMRLTSGAGGGGADTELDQLIARTSQPDPADERGRSTTGGEVDPSIPPQPMPEEEHWYTNLLAPVAGALPGGALAHAANNPGLNAGVQGYAHGVTGGADQNIPVYGNFARQQRQDARAEAPGPYAAGDALGAIANPMNRVGGVLSQMGGAAAQGFTRGFSDEGTDASLADRSVAGGIQGVESAGLAGLVSGGARLVGAGASAVANGVRSVADRARNIGWGTPAAALEEFGAQRGLSPNDALRQFVSEGEQIAPPNVLAPKPPGTYQPQFKAGQQAAGQQVGQSMADAQAEGIAQMDPNARGTLLRRLDAERDQAFQAGVNRMPYVNALGGEISAVQRGPALDTPQALRQAKTSFGQSAYGSDPQVGEAASKEAADFGRGVVRDQLQDYMGQASPAIGQSFDEGNKAYGVASTLNRATTDRANAINTGAGGGIGGQGFMGRMMNMVPGGSLIPDAAANAGRLVQNATGGFGAALSGAASNGPVGAMSARAPIQDWLAAKGVTVDNVPQQSRGNQLAAAAQQLLQTEPQAFGQYTQQIQQAAQQGPEALNSLIGQLEGETPFRTGPMLRLQHMSGEN